MKSYVRVLGIVIIVLVIFLITDFMVGKKVKNLIDEEPSLTFEKLKVNTFFGSLVLKNVEFEETGKNIQIKEVRLTVNLFQYLIHKNIVVKDLYVRGFDLDLDVSEEGNKNSSLNFDIQINRIELNDVNLRVKDDGENRIEILNLGLLTHDFTWLQDDEFDWLDHGTLKLNAKTIFYNLDDLHILRIHDFSLVDQSLSLSNLKIEPKFSKSAYVNYIETEKDLIQLCIKSFKICTIELEKKDSIMAYKAAKIQIDNSDLNIYRDKSIAEDQTIKPLYSKMLRDLRFQFLVDSVLVSDANIVYQELAAKDQLVGEIKFNHVNGHLINLHNELNAEKSDIMVNLQAKFSKQSDINFNLKLVPDNEQFYVSTHLKNVEDKSVNNFFSPAMHMEIEGVIDKVETSFSGNNSEINGDFAIAYEKLKLNTLNKDGSKNNFTSLFTNLLIKNKNADKQINVEEVRRDPTKSFWNYIWKFHLKGLKESLL